MSPLERACPILGSSLCFLSFRLGIWLRPRKGLARLAISGLSWPGIRTSMVQPRGMKIRIFCGYFFSFSKLYAGGETRINHTLSSKEDHFVKEKKNPYSYSFSVLLYLWRSWSFLILYTSTLVKQYDFSCPSVSSRTYLQSKSAVKEEKPCSSVKDSGPFVNVPGSLQI